jgi:hypothetical protein
MSLMVGIWILFWWKLREVEERLRGREGEEFGSMIEPHLT